jgi:ABC-type nitrate/sulfonate/bicarbonate transport system substrate-binding protein
MPRLLRHTLLSVRDLAVSAGPFVVLALVLLWGAYLLLDPAPPKRVVLATGPEQGAYAEFGKRYAERLKGLGIEVVLKGTQGSAENLALLRDPAQNVDLAFVQGGSGAAVLAVDEENSGVPLVSLGSLFYEPVWLFYREDAAKRLNRNGALSQLAQLAGWRVNIGAPGSGAPPLWAKLLHANRIDPASIRTSELAPTPAVVAFLAGELDALLFVSAPESPLVQMLLQTPGVKLFDFAQAEAYSRRLPFLGALKLPRGVVDLARDIPPADVQLIAPTSSLVAREHTHPALVQLFVQTAQVVHGGTGWFARAGTFPSPANVELPLAAEAARFYRSGPPLLQRYLPFWLANLIDRMWVALVSIVAVLIPLSRIVPPLYEFRIRSRIFRWYGQLREIEEELGRRSTPPEELAKALDALDAKVERINVPLSHADELYALRSHIGMVRARLREAAG